MHIAMLGPLEVRTSDGALADVPGARLRGLLVALALRPGYVVPKAVLVDWIWGENPPADAANALQRLVSRLRKALPEAAFEGLPEGYRLGVEPDAVDAVRFERLVVAAQAGGQAGTGDVATRARLLREALTLWRGAAMQDVGLADSGACEAAAVRLEALRLTAAEERFDAELALGHGPDLVSELTDLVAAHPLRERLAGALMRALAAAGRDNEALQVYQRAREALADALGADPSPELSELHVALLRGELVRREETRKSNLRAELTTFVGRDADVAAVRDLVGRHRLTTVTGPGGAGKTRLAEESARGLVADLPDGAWLVELAAIGPDGDVAQAALSGLGLRDTLLGDASHAEAVERFVAAVRDRETLLILDNCEHVIEAAAVFAHRVLGECRRLRILATSREPLGITGEALWPVEPLPLPGEAADGEQIAAAPAVRLFRDRAQAVRPDLAGDPAALATMARICRALDGMPLAIELAAARLRTMSLEQLADRLDDRFRLLTGGSRTALPRHRTLRAVVDWSWELLSAAERRVLRRLAVFAGGAGLEAAEEVCAGGASGGVGGGDRPADTAELAGAVEPEDVLDLLTALTEKSLLVTRGEGAPRYRMSGTVKEYAAMRLAEAGETESARLAHLEFFTALAETAEPRLRRADQLKWLAALEADHDNLTSAMRWALAAGAAWPAMRLAAASGWYWWLGGHRAEGIELLTAASRLYERSTVGGGAPDGAGESAAATIEAEVTVYALLTMFVSGGRGDQNVAAEWITKAHRAAVASPAAVRSHPGTALVDPLVRILEDPTTALTAFEPQLDHPDPWVRALARLQMGKMRVVFGDAGREADAFLEAALAEFERIGERFGISFALSELAERLAMRGEFGRACELYERAVVVVTEAGTVEDVIRIRSRLAVLYRMVGDRDATAAALAEAERSAERVTWPSALVELALAKVDLARWDGDRDEARRQLGIASDLLGEQAQEPNYRAMIHDLHAHLAEDLEEARAHHTAALRAAPEAGHALLIATVLVGVAGFALRRDRPDQAARLLAAAAAVRGLPDDAHPDVASVAQEAQRRLGAEDYAEAVAEGTRSEWPDLVGLVLAP
ncbi:BTAD domain-containing putative transcriptional regulator [Catenulispora yoronensis]|uniref:BTAD domain-containing putative transcriptional regulator n=1 Tax=Catenulispora yoronensis TaxID=450799 RepID=A0ABN2VM58_9ACTN